jgi:glycosyltransferase involved in cell wall biosynthesis
VASGDPVALADRLTALLRHEPIRARMGRAARKRMREEFSFEAQAAAYVRLFESLRPARTAVAA